MTTDTLANVSERAQGVACVLYGSAYSESRCATNWGIRADQLYGASLAFTGDESYWLAYLEETAREQRRAVLLGPAVYRGTYNHEEAA